MTSKCFYSPAKSECKEKRHIYSVTLWHSTETLLCNRGVTQATELTFWSNTLHTHTPCLPKMRIQFSRQEKGLNTNADLCQPRHSGSVPANRLLLCDGVDIGSGIEAQVTGADTCCSSRFSLYFNENLPASCLHHPSLWPLPLRVHGTVKGGECASCFRCDLQLWWNLSRFWFVGLWCGNSQGQTAWTTLSWSALY